jgi:HTH-type transcriptional regulator / antitoxin HigA
MRRMTAKKRSDGELVADDYFELVRRFPLRPIRVEGEYNRAVEILKELIGRADVSLTAGESDYADVLGRLVAEYDRDHSSILKQKPTPVEMLKYLMGEHGINTSGLGKLLDSGAGQASLILNGKRELSKSNIRTLAERFKVSAAIFI